VDLHGILAMEAFVGTDDRLIFNEIAPRPHNSFHWTIEGCTTSQFRQLVRIITGLGAGDTAAKGLYVMENLLGEDLHRLDSLYADGRNAVHLYGKAEARNGRKMGHVTYQK
jgi:5-(carboxyamino)imidazole ribonucleotide synthase